MGLYRKTLSKKIKRKKLTIWITSVEFNSTIAPTPLMHTQKKPGVDKKSPGHIIKAITIPNVNSTVTNFSDEINF